MQLSHSTSKSCCACSLREIGESTSPSWWWSCWAYASFAERKNPIVSARRVCCRMMAYLRVWAIPPAGSACGCR